MDTHSEVKAFQRAVEENRQHPITTNQVIGEIIGALERKTTADYHLREFVAMVELGVYANPEETTITISSNMASPILELGLAIKSRVDALNLYDERGILNYTMYEDELEDDYEKVIPDVIIVSQLEIKEDNETT